MYTETTLPSRRVLVVDLGGTLVSDLVDLTGWHVTVGSTHDAHLPEMFRSVDPNVILVAAGVYVVAVEQLLSIRRRPVVCAGQDDWRAILGLLENGANGYLRLPAEPAQLASCLESACISAEQIELLSHERHLLAQTLETRKLVDRAKAIFMRRLNLDEPSAHKRLQQESQNRRIAIGDLARRIIESEELLGERTTNREN